MKILSENLVGGIKTKSKSRNLSDPTGSTIIECGGKIVKHILRVTPFLAIVEGILRRVDQAQFPG